MQNSFPQFYLKSLLHKLIFPPLGEDVNRRSIWRESKFMALVLLTGIMTFDEVVENFVEISRLLFVEKRQKKERVLQLVGLG